MSVRLVGVVSGNISRNPLFSPIYTRESESPHFRRSTTMRFAQSLTNLIKSGIQLQEYLGVL